MESEINYTTIDKNKIIEYIYNLLYIYNSTSHNSNDINPYDSPLVMKIDGANEIIIPDKIRIECIKSWHEKKIIKPKKVDTKIFVLTFFKLTIGVCLIVLILYTLSLFRFITKKYTF